mgnify:CR=1 FL=1|tara:strand:- start:1522 stop:2214 length:693 start_codon:yes stop_codon:yes gene_type:complete
MSLLNLYEYKGTYSGLDKLALTKLLQILDNINIKDNINILEFGSGQSTKFLVDYKLKTNKNIFIDSYDHDINYCYKNNNNYNFLNIYIKPLIQCNDYNYNKQLEEIKFNRENYSIAPILPYNHPKFWRQRNCIYDINTDELKNIYDIIIVDGPNGNGRNLSYLFFKDRVKPGTFILIDDFNSCDDSFNYNFIENLKKIINVKEIYRSESKSNNAKDTWENGGNFMIFKVI